MSGNIYWLKAVLDQTHGQIPFDAIGLRPYGQRPTHCWPDGWGHGYAGDRISQYYKAFGKPIWMTEMGVKTNDDQFQADFLTRFYQMVTDNLQGIIEQVCWFCYSDSMQPSYGLVTELGTPKAAYTAYQKLRTANQPVGLVNYSWPVISRN